MIKKVFFFQALVGVALFSFKIIFSFSNLSFVVGFLFAQFYAWFFLSLSQLLFKRKKRKWFITVVSFKWLILVFVLYGFLQVVEPIGFFIGLISMPSFFIIFAFLNRDF